MRTDDHTTWFEHSLDAAPDFTLLVALRSDDTIHPSLDVVAAHFAVRGLTWELIAVALDGDVGAPFGDELANAFFVRRSRADDRLEPLRRAAAQASGHRVLLAGADLTVGLVHLDDVMTRLDAGSDIVVGWPHPDAVDPIGSDLPTFLGCAGGVMRALGDTRSVYGGSTFSDAMQIAHFWGLAIDELQVDVAVADIARPRASIRPMGRVDAGPAGAMGAKGSIGAIGAIGTIGTFGSSMP